MLKYIDKIGIEIEGGWSERRDDLIPEGSLREADFPDCACYGEIISAPLDSENQAITFVRENWPDGTAERCGYHVHFSFKNISFYSLCISRDFYNKFLIAMDEWGKRSCKNPLFWKRLSGDNRFCRKEFIPERQIHNTKKGIDLRYTHWNYCYAFHKTIECRLFPTFQDAETAVSGLKALISFVEGYLESIPEKDKEYDFVVRESVIDDEPKDKAYEEFFSNAAKAYAEKQRERELKKRLNKRPISQSVISASLEAIGHTAVPSINSYRDLPDSFINNCITIRPDGNIRPRVIDEEPEERHEIA
jgi:hypothetical protein